MARILVVVALFMTLVPGTARAQTATEVWEYTGSADAAQACHSTAGPNCYPATIGFCIGGACTYASGTSVDLEIADATGLPVGAFWQLAAADCSFPLPCRFEERARGRFCGSVAGIPVPDDAEALFVFLDGPAFGPLDCIGEGSSGIATTGALTITIHE